MFEQLTNRLEEIFYTLRRRGKLSERDVDQAMREIRLALLEADVDYSVVRNIVSGIKERAVGEEVSRALNPGQQVVKIVHEELIETLGEPAPLQSSDAPLQVIMLVGLQGTGKTTTAAKIARKLDKQGQNVMLVAADPYRPAAIQQLVTLGDQLSIPVYSDPTLSPAELAEKALQSAKTHGVDVLILDTAGRSQIDPDLMDELKAIHQAVHPSDVLLVVDAMIGQEAVNVAEGFKRLVPLTGLVISKMDGDARGGAAISIRSITGIPIKFLGTGEDLPAIEHYDPTRLASRILGMGDVVGLIERAEEAVDQETARAQADKLMKGEFTLDDFAQQLSQVKKMGSIGRILDLMPGDIGRITRDVDPRQVEKQFQKTEAIIHSMTPEERRNPKILNASRRKRIAAGSGTQVYDINQLIKQYHGAKKMVEELKKSGLGNISHLFGS